MCFLTLVVFVEKSKDNTKKTISLCDYVIFFPAHEASEGRGHNFPTDADHPADWDHLLQSPRASWDPQRLLWCSAAPSPGLGPSAVCGRPLSEIGMVMIYLLASVLKSVLSSDFFYGWIITRYNLRGKQVTTMFQKPVFPHILTWLEHSKKKMYAIGGNMKWSSGIQSIQWADMSEMLRWLFVFKHFEELFNWSMNA